MLEGLWPWGEQIFLFDAAVITLILPAQLLPRFLGPWRVAALVAGLFFFSFWSPLPYVTLVVACLGVGAVLYLQSRSAWTERGTM